MGIPHTYYDGNPEDRNTTDDFWSWLKDQPQAAWLNYAREANWDNADLIFAAMVQEPACDRALASWLFWRADAAFYIAEGERPHSDSLLGLILGRVERGGFPSSGLHYARVEVAHNAQDYVAALRRLRTPPPFALPRELCASFDGENSPLPAYDAQTEHDLAEVFHSLDGQLHRSDAAFFDDARRSGNMWFEPAINLPTPPRSLDGLDDAAAIEAVFGNHERWVVDREAARLRSLGRGPAQSRIRGWGWPKWMLLYAVIAIGGAMIAHRIRTGSW